MYFVDKARFRGIQIIYILIGGISNASPSPASYAAESLFDLDQYSELDWVYLYIWIMIRL